MEGLPRFFGPSPFLPEARKLKARRHPRSHSPRGERKFALPELSITQGKHETLIRTAHYFLRERQIKECPLRFEVVAIDNTPGQPPVARLHKSALNPVVHRHSDW